MSKRIIGLSVVGLCGALGLVGWMVAVPAADAPASHRSKPLVEEPSSPTRPQPPVVVPAYRPVAGKTTEAAPQETGISPAQDESVADEGPTYEHLGDGVYVFSERIEPELDLDNSDDGAPSVEADRVEADRFEPQRTVVEPVDPREEGYGSLEEMESAVRSAMQVPDDVAVQFGYERDENGKKLLAMVFTPTQDATPPSSPQ